jgi:hypothetical protein
MSIERRRKPATATSPTAEETTAQGSAAQVRQRDEATGASQWLGRVREDRKKAAPALIRFHLA